MCGGHENILRRTLLSSSPSGRGIKGEGGASVNRDGLELSCVRGLFDAFSLTPALSRWERENRRQRRVNPSRPLHFTHCP